MNMVERKGPKTEPCNNNNNINNNNNNNNNNNVTDWAVARRRRGKHVSTNPQKRQHLLMKRVYLTIA
jgi:hypothetical protein